MGMRQASLLLAILPVCAMAQEDAIQRALIQRDQQSDAFTLQLRQSQERLAVPPGDLRRQQEVEARQLAERQRLGEVSESQLRDAKPDTPTALRPHERQRAQEERRPLVTPE